MSCVSHVMLYVMLGHAVPLLPRTKNIIIVSIDALLSYATIVGRIQTT